MSIDSKRRFFLSLACHSPLLWGFGSNRAFSAQSIQLGEGLLCSPGRASNGQHVLQTLHLGDRLQNTLPLPFLAHSICFDPQNPGKAAVLPQRPGREACIVDLVRNRIIVRIPATPDQNFYGHGAYSLDGRVLYVTATDGQKGAGTIELRNTLDGRLIDKVNTFGLHPHDMTTVDHGATAMVCNWGDSPSGASASFPSLAAIDLASGRLIAREFLPGKHTSIRHLSALDSDTVAVAVFHKDRHDPEFSCVALKTAGKPLTLMPASACPQSLGSLALSAVIHPENRIAGFTHPESGYLSFWSLHDFSCIQSIKSPDPQGIAVSPNGKYFLATSTRGNVTVVDAQTLNVVNNALGDIEGFNWRHANVLAAREDSLPPPSSS